MVRIPDPRESAEYADRDCDVRDNTHDQNGVVIVLVVDENECHAEYQPGEA